MKQKGHGEQQNRYVLRRTSKRAAPAMLCCSIDERLHGHVDGSTRWYIVALTTVYKGTISSIVIKIKADNNDVKKKRERK